MDKYLHIINMILGLPKTIYFNFKYFNFNQAIKFPVILSNRVVLEKTKGDVIINCPIKPGLIKIGFGGVRAVDSNAKSKWSVKGTVIFNGRASIGVGSKIAVYGGTLELGDNFAISALTSILCNKSIVFGDDVLIGWECLIMDTDAHSILNENGDIVNSPRNIRIGDKVWLGTRCIVSKGTTIANNVVVGAGSNVYGKNNTPNCVIGGSPIKILRENTTWSK